MQTSSANSGDTNPIRLRVSSDLEMKRVKVSSLDGFIAQTVEQHTHNRLRS